MDTITIAKKNDWKNLLDPKMEKKITTTFHKDMKDLKKEQFVNEKKLASAPIYYTI